MPPHPSEATKKRLQAALPPACFVLALVAIKLLKAFIQSKHVLEAYESLFDFFFVALLFTGLLTLVVRLAKLRVRHELPEDRSLVLTLGFVAFLLAAWWFATNGATVEDRMIPPIILPSPFEVLQSFPDLHVHQALVRSALISFMRVTIGFLLAVIVALPLGIYMATFTPISAFFRPLALIGAYVPIVVFVPLTIAWFGLSELQKIGFLFIGCFVALLPLVIKSISKVPAAYLDVAVTKGATQWQLVRHVLFPVAQADIWDNLRAVYGVGWGWIILAEVVNAERGLGHLIDVSTRRSHTDAIFAVILVIVCIAVACDLLWRFGGQLLFPYLRK